MYVAGKSDSTNGLFVVWRKDLFQKNENKLTSYGMFLGWKYIANIADDVNIGILFAWIAQNGQYDLTAALAIFDAVICPAAARNMLPSALKPTLYTSQFESIQSKINLNSK